MSTSYGLAIYTEAGFLQVTDTFRSYGLLSSGVMTTINGGWASADIPASNDSVVVFLQLPVGDRWVIPTVTSTKVNARVVNNSGSGVDGIAIGYRIYSIAMSSTADQYGLRVFTQDNLIAFDSGRRYPKVRNVVNFHPWLNTTAASRSISYGSFSSPWFQIGNTWLYSTSDQDGSEDIVWELGYKHAAPGTIVVGSMRRFIYPYSSNVILLRPSGSPTVTSSVALMLCIAEG